MKLDLFLFAASTVINTAVVVTAGDRHEWTLCLGGLLAATASLYMGFLKTAHMAKLADREDGRGK